MACNHVSLWVFVFGRSLLKRVPTLQPFPTYLVPLGGGCPRTRGSERRYSFVPQVAGRQTRIHRSADALTHFCHRSARGNGPASTVSKHTVETADETGSKKKRESAALTLLGGACLLLSTAPILVPGIACRVRLATATKARTHCWLFISGTAPRTGEGEWNIRRRARIGQALLAPQPVSRDSRA
jgi:hypothetical protein